MTVKGNNGESTQARLMFKISVHIRDKSLLEGIARFFGVGKISTNATSCQYIIQSISSLGPIINHFETYPLVTKKRLDFEFFKLAYRLVVAKEHLVEDGFQRYINLKASIHSGKYYPDLLAQYPSTVQVPVPSYDFKEGLNPF